MPLSPHPAKYIAHDLTLQHAGGGIERLSHALLKASVDLNPRNTLTEQKTCSAARDTLIRKNPEGLVHGL